MELDAGPGLEEEVGWVELTGVEGVWRLADLAEETRAGRSTEEAMWGEMFEGAVEKGSSGRLD